MVAFARTLDARFGAWVQHEERLDRHTTLGVGGTCRHLVAPRSVDEASEALALLHRHGVPVFVLGGGSNLLIRDEGFDGAVLNLSALRKVRQAGDRFRVDAGTPLSMVCKLALRAGLGGLEGLVGIPGTLGGAVYMNAGGRHSEVGDVCESVLVADRRGRTARLGRDQIGFAYRRTKLQGLVVLEATLRLRPRERDEICRDMAHILKRKHRTQPMGQRSAGCVFKNPGPRRAAALLIDRAGLKGTRAGGAEVSVRHANFIVNTQRARARDVLDLIAKVRREVLVQHGTPLALEVQVLGPRGLETR